MESESHSYIFECKSIKAHFYDFDICNVCAIILDLHPKHIVCTYTYLHNNSCNDVHFNTIIHLNWIAFIGEWNMCAHKKVILLRGIIMEMLFFMIVMKYCC